MLLNAKAALESHEVHKSLLFIVSLQMICAVAQSKSDILFLFRVNLDLADFLMVGFDSNRDGDLDLGGLA